jgi:hypothetical protein
MTEKSRRVREPIQVYLDGRDRSLLDRLASEAGVSRAEILRMGLRRLANDVAGEARGAGFRALMGVIDGPDVPRDLASRHDEYLYPATKPGKTPRRKRKSAP